MYYLTSATPVDAVFSVRAPSKCSSETNTNRNRKADQNIRKDVKKNTKRICLDFLLNRFSELWNINKDWLYTLKAAIFNYAKGFFFLEYMARGASRVNMGL